MEEAVTFTNDSGEKLVGELHSPGTETDKGIVLAHCFTCSKHVKIIRDLCHALSEKGFLVLRFDFSGNGESEGKFEEATYTKEIGDLQKAIDFVQSRGATKIGVLGHSMGSAVSILTSSQDSRVESLCVIAGASSTSQIKDIFPQDVVQKAEAEGSAELNIFGKNVTITKNFLDDSDKYNISEALGSFAKPFCVIHGDKDSVIDVSHAKNLDSYAQGEKELHIIEGADHMFSSEANFKEMRDITVNWFVKTITTSK